MVTLTDLFPAGALQAALDAGFLRTQDHPELPLMIYNYTEKCAYEDAWDETTLICRGLIVNAETGEIVARPYRKFFNHGQSGAPTFALDEPVEVTDKADGSLGILYATPEGYAVATRGSFASDQAVRATTLLRKRYPEWTPPVGQTVLFEIIYPENRIVVDYGGMEDLVLLGAVETVSGRSIGPEQVAWPGPRVETFAYATFGAALAAPARPNREGLVVHAPATGERVKIKYADYLRLHKIVTGLTSRSIWEALAGGATVAEVCEPLPDEFHSWARDVADRLFTFVDAGVASVEQAFAAIVADLPEGYSRKDFALVAGAGEPLPGRACPSRQECGQPTARSAISHKLRGLLFARLDGRDLRPALWQAAKPVAGETPHGRSFDDE